MRYRIGLALLALLADTGELRAQSFFSTNAPTSGASSITATGGTTPLSLADREGYWLGLLDVGASRSGAVDAGSLATTFLTGRTGLGGQVQGYFPKGTYLFGSPVDAGGRNPTWLAAQDASLDAFALGQNGGAVVRPRRSLAWTFGTYDNATAASIIANPAYDQPAQVSGFSTPSKAATVASRDSVALYVSNNSLPANTVAASTYTATTIIPPSNVDTSKLKVGMMIDTLHSPKYTGTITDWAADGSSITVSGWFQQGNEAAGQVPANAFGAVINPIIGIWSINSVNSLALGSPAATSIGYELDTINNQQAYVDNINPAAAPSYMWGFYTTSFGTFDGAAGYLQSGKYYDGYRSTAAANSGFRVSTSGTRNPTYGFLYDMNGGSGTAFSARDATTANPYFGVINKTQLLLGDGSATFAINMFAEQSTGIPVRDAQLVAGSGGVLALRANTIQLQNTIANSGLSVTASASGVNFFAIQGTVTGVGPTLTATGSDAAVDANYLTKTTGSHSFKTGNGTQFQVIDGGASTVNYTTLAGGATGNSVKEFAAGTDATINRVISGKSTGLVCLGAISDCGNEAVRIVPVASQVNSVRLTAAATTAAPSIQVTGSDANVNMNLITKGSGVLQTNGTSGVSCAAGTVSAATMVVTNGLVTHC